MAINTKATYACAYKMFERFAKYSEEPVHELHVHGNSAWFTAIKSGKRRTHWTQQSIPWWKTPEDASQITNIFANIARKHNIKTKLEPMTHDNIDDYGRPTFVISFTH